MHHDQLNILTCFIYIHIATVKKSYRISMAVVVNRYRTVSHINYQEQSGGITLHKTAIISNISMRNISRYSADYSHYMHHTVNSTTSNQAF